MNVYPAADADAAAPAASFRPKLLLIPGPYHLLNARQEIIEVAVSCCLVAAWQISSFAFA